MNRLYYFLITISIAFFASCADEVDTDKYFLSDEFLKLGTTEINIDGGGGTQTISVSSNCSWNMSTTGDWISLSPTSGHGNASITLSAQANNNITTDRNATITVSSAGGLQRTIHVHQARSNEILSFNVDQLTFASKGETKSLVIESNSTWEIRGAEEWFTLSQTSGKGNATISISAIENGNENERTAILTISGTTLSDHVTITQEGRSTNLTASVTNISFEAIGGTQGLRLEGTATWTATSSATWLTLDKISGEGTDELQLTCDANNLENERQATITISYGAISKHQTIVVSVTQKAAQLPVLTQPVAVSVGREQMTVKSSVSSHFPITERGFVWSTTNSTPTTANSSKRAEGTSEGSFQTDITGLSSGTTYYIRAFATSAVGTAYSPVLTVTTAGGRPGEDDNPTPNL